MTVLHSSEGGSISNRAHLLIASNSLVIAPNS